MNELETLSIEELYIYKKYLIGEIKKLQAKTREMDKQIKKLKEVEDEYRI